MSDSSELLTLNPAVQSGQVELSHMGVIEVSGADATAFLQGQLTQDVALLGTDAARLAAYCNAKGRMQVSFIVIRRSAEQLLLLCARESVAAMVKRLSMFVLRAKVRISDVTDQYRMFGLTGSAIEALVPGLSSRPAWSRQDKGEAMVVHLYPGAGVARACWLAPLSAPAPHGIDSVSLGYWHWLSVRSGLAMVGPATFEAFVPQMLNYESVGGVSFKKGCYPGQEVVARSQFRGSIKRRAYLVHAQAALLIGQEVFHDSDGQQACGLIAAAAPRPDGQGFDAIVSMQVSAAQAEAGHLRAADPAAGPVLSLMPLPYALLEDI
ncbi:MAG: YgfZ/GcvT domain-containing protein [Burkholderiaceae bacterium]|jgi:folate-binding protein YgfZ